MQRREFITLLATASTLPFTSFAAPAFAQNIDKRKKMSNPILEVWDTPFGVPPFDKIKPSHFMPALEIAMKEHDAELLAISSNKEDPTFDNVFVPMEKSGQNLNKVAYVFFHLSSADTNPEIQKIEGEISQKFTEHQSKISQNEPLFNKIRSVHERRKSLGLNDVQIYLVEKTYDGFVKGGALLSEKDKKRVSEIDSELSKLQVQFDQNVLKGQTDFVLPLTKEEDFKGLSESQIDAAKAEAKNRKIDALGAITLSRSSFEPFLTNSQNRELRKKVQDGWTSVGSTFGPDNRPIIKQLLDLRTERAHIMGYKSYADFQLSDKMAKTPQNAMDMMQKVWAASLATAKREKASLEAIAQKQGMNDNLKSYDWWYYAEEVRKEKYNIDENEVKPYFELNNMVDALHYTANQLFGLKFEKRTNIPTWHDDVVSYEVFDENGKTKAIWFGDFYARPSKQSGAWMSSLREQQKLAGDIKPLVFNVCNYAKPSEGKPTLLSFDDAVTLFHEFGHALHGMLSDVTYPSQSGTNVIRDFVEFPSQLIEHWLPTKEILSKYARHYRTNEAIPEELVDKLLAAKNFNEGWATTEYMSASIMDMKMHLIEGPAPSDIDAWEKQILDEIGLIPEIVVRYRPGYFKHTFSGGYSAGYYSYIWAAVLETDAFNAFKEAGNVFDKATAKRLKDDIFSTGGTKDPMELYIEFRGRAPKVDALLEYRGLHA